LLEQPRHAYPFVGVRAHTSEPGHCTRHAPQCASFVSATQLFAPQHTRPLPHPVPSGGAEREQLSVAVVVLVTQLAARHVRVVTDRDREPVVSHAFANPPQPDHAPVVVLPHVSPSVSRMQASVSTRGMNRHTPSMHVGSITVRERDPLSAQTEAYSQAPHAPSCATPQSAAPSHASHVCRISLQKRSQGGDSWIEHVPSPQRSVPLQYTPSSHSSSFASNTHPRLGSHVSVVHPSPSSHTTSTPTHAPEAPHASCSVHALPSSQDTPRQSGSAQSLRPSQSSSIPSSQAVSISLHAPSAQPATTSQRSPSRQRDESGRKKHSPSTQSGSAQSVGEAQSLD
jgi:hypothetical protein